MLLLYKELCPEVSSFVRIVVVVYVHITLFTDILKLECMLDHQSLGVCEVSDPYTHYIV